MDLKDCSQGVIHKGRGAQYEGSMQYFDGKKMMHGEGRLVHKDKVVYHGEFVRHKMEGKGRMELPDRSVYHGSWKADEKHGHGLWQYGEVDGAYYEGEFRNDVKDGKGKERFPGHVPPFEFEGEFRKDSFNGKGVMRWLECGTVCSDGTWKNNLRTGHGYRRWPTGNVYLGNWTKDRVEGTGTLILANQECLHGTFEGCAPSEGHVVRADGTVVYASFKTPSKRLGKRPESFLELLTQLPRPTQNPILIGNFLEWRGKIEGRSWVGQYVDVNGWGLNGNFVDWIFPTGECAFHLLDAYLSQTFHRA